MKSSSSTKYSTLIGASELADNIFLAFSIDSNNLNLPLAFLRTLNPPDYYSNYVANFSKINQSISLAPKFLSFTYATTYAFSLQNDPTNAENLE